MISINRFEISANTTLTCKLNPGLCLGRILKSHWIIIHILTWLQNVFGDKDVSNIIKELFLLEVSSW